MEETTSSFKCTLCEKTFEKQRYLSNHIKRIHEDNHRNYSKCDICEKQFLLTGELNQHKKVHGKKRFVRCAICNKSINSTYIKKHIYEHEKPKQYIECTFCGNTFTTKHHLGLHIENVHEGLKKYKCENISLKKKV